MGLSNKFRAKLRKVSAARKAWTDNPTDLMLAKYRAEIVMLGILFLENANAIVQAVEAWEKEK